MSYLPYKLVKKSLWKRIPTDVNLEVTRRCNLACSICYISGVGPELSTPEVKSALADLAGEGCLFLTVTGGEPLLRPDLMEILDYATDQGFAVTLKTNGTLLERKHARQLKTLRIRDVHISLLGGSADVHDAITGIKGSFQKVIAAIGFIKAAGIKVYLMSVVTSGHIAEMEKIERIARETGADNYFFDSLVIPKTNKGKKPLKARLTDTELKEFFKYLWSENSISSDSRKQRFCQKKDGDLLLTCGAGRNGVSLSPDGKVIPCISFPVELGDIRRQTLREILNSKKTDDFIETIRLKNTRQCWRCPDKFGCFRCPGLAYLENGAARNVPSEGCRQIRIKKEVANEKEKKAL